MRRGGITPGYEARVALHCTIIAADGKPVTIYIRSERLPAPHDVLRYVNPRTGAIEQIIGGGEWQETRQAPHDDRWVEARLLVHFPKNRTRPPR